MNRRASALGIDTNNLVRSEEEIQAMEQQAQQQAMMQQMGPKAMQMAGDVMKEQPPQEQAE